MTDFYDLRTLPDTLASPSTHCGDGSERERSRGLGEGVQSEVAGSTLNDANRRFQSQTIHTYTNRHSYTANDYTLPQTPEFWVNNFLYAKADWASVELDCTISSDPTQRQSISAASARRGFMPYLVGYDDWDT